VAATDVATVALPDASAACAGTSATCAASSIERPVAGASAPAPGACSSAASAALGEGSAGSHLSGGAFPLCRFPSPLPLPTTTVVAGGERPCCSRSWNSSLLCSWRSRRRIPRSFLRVARSCSCRCVARVRSGSGRGRVGPRGVHGHPLLGSTKRQSRDGTWWKNKGKGEELTH
jgi:hypothetical protein